MFRQNAAFTLSTPAGCMKTALILRAGEHEVEGTSSNQLVIRDAMLYNGSDSFAEAMRKMRDHCDRQHVEETVWPDGWNADSNERTTWRLCQQAVEDDQYAGG